jgi:hypothetical protein
MKIEELKQKLETPIEASDTWLKNQWPAQPNKRYSELTYLNYQNLSDVFPDRPDLKEQTETVIKEHPKIQLVILARLDSKGRVTGFIALHEPDSLYYGQYELFAGAYHLKGFCEVFHNIKNT